MSSRSVPIERPYSTSWLIITDILSRTVSELSHLTVEILDTLRFWAALIVAQRQRTMIILWQNVGSKSAISLKRGPFHWKARCGLHISVNWTFFARCYGWGCTSGNRSKINDFAPTRSLWPNILGRMGSPPPIAFARIVTPINAL